MKIKYTIDNKEVEEMYYYAEVREMLLTQLVNELIADSELPEGTDMDATWQEIYEDDGIDYIVDGLDEDYYFDSRAGLKKDGFYEQEINGLLFREEIIKDDKEL